MKDRNKLAHVWILRLLPLTLLFFSGSAAATLFGFGNITANDLDDAATGEAQLSVEVTDVGVGVGTDQVLFIFRNEGPNASSITDVYFADGSLLGIPDVMNMAGVEFTAGARPGELPGGNEIGFETTAGFSADSDSPVSLLGVDPGEELRILFDLQDGQDLDDVLAELSSGALRIGIHVQAFGSGSESFVNVAPVPEPGALLVFVAGFLTVELTRRRSKTHRRA